MATILKGAPVAEALAADTAARAAALTARGVTPKLAILRVGERAEDLSYERGAMKRCAAAGIAVRQVALPAWTSQDKLMAAVEALNEFPSVHGILMLRPLPVPLDGEAARRALLPAKDVDGVTDGSLAGVFTGSGEGFAPCTAQAVVELLKFYDIPLRGANVTVAGRSLVVGRPAAMLLMEAGATVTLCHSGTKDLAAHTRSADILVAAIGKMGYFGAEHIAPGQTVVDVGIHMDEAAGRLRGDVRFDEIEPIAGAVTPVPGGLGAVTTAVLVRHVVEAAEKQYPG